MVDFGEYREQNAHDKRALKRLGIRHVDNEVLATYLDAVTSQHDELAIYRSNLFQAENNWVAAGRPYYKVWDCIARSFAGIDASRISTSQVMDGTSGIGAMVMRFRPLEELGGLRAALLLRAKCQRKTGEQTECLIVYTDYGEEYGHFGSLWHWHLRFDESDDSFAEEMQRTVLRGQQGVSREQRIRGAMACVFCAMIPQDDSIIDRDVLVGDDHRYRVTLDPALVEKAVRKGKNGWHIGREFESAPHYRRPHPALYWTGQGRKVPKVVFRSGCLVHREVVAKVPTGKYGSEPVEV